MPGSSERRPGPAGTRERIVELLRRTALTANEIAARLGLTHNAVRVHLASLLEDGVVRQGGRRPTVSRPALVYEVTPDAEARLSAAYAPFAAALVRSLAESLPGPDAAALLRAAGRRLATSQPPLDGDLPERVAGASALLARLGAAHEVTREGGAWVIRGHGCPIAAATRECPEACGAMETFLGALVEAPVGERCERGERPRCRFEIGGTPTARQAPGAGK